MAEPSRSSSPAVLQTLAWIRQQGFRPVLLNYQSKAAVSQTYPNDNPSDNEWRRGNFGIGVLTGPKIGGPVDIDLDCPEALFFAPRFLPPTKAIFGRPGKPNSHMLYKVSVPELDKKAFSDPVEKATIVEIRADGGHQTVFPGSVHQDTGEPISWSGVPFPDLPTVDDELLTKAVRKVALATLLSRHVWHDGSRNEMLLPLSGLFFYLDWALEDVQALMQAVMDYTGDDDKTRMRTVALTYTKGEKGGKVSGATTLRRLTGNDVLVDRLLDLAGSPTINLLQEYNERFAVVNFEGRFRIADTDRPNELPQLMLKDDFLNFMSTDLTTIDDKPAPKAKLWLASPRRRSYRALDFIPGETETGDVLNLWPGWAVAPDATKSCEGWFVLLKRVICNDDAELYEWMLNWLGGIIKAPCEKAMTAPVMIGKPGAGKSLVLNYFGKILGETGYTTVNNPDQIYGKFNKHMATTLLLHSAEALWGSEMAHRSIIKSLITDDWRIFEQKGVDAKQVKNYLRLALTSNYAHAAPVESGDRRFTILDLGDRMIDDDLKKQVLKELKDGGPAALLSYFQKADYSAEKSSVNVKNEALDDLKSLNFTPIEAWWHATLASGQLLPNYLHWAQRPTKDYWPPVVGSPALYQSCLVYLKDRGERKIPNDTAFGIQLLKMLGHRGARLIRKSQRDYVNPIIDEAPQSVKLLSDRQISIVNLPDLRKCRKAFMMHTGQHIEWPEDAPDDEKPPQEKF